VFLVEVVFGHHGPDTAVLTLLHRLRAVPTYRVKGSSPHSVVSFLHPPQGGGMLGPIQGGPFRARLSLTSSDRAAASTRISKYDKEVQE